jgi:hypothetical protein
MVLLRRVSVLAGGPQGSKEPLGNTLSALPGSFAIGFPGLGAGRRPQELPRFGWLLSGDGVVPRYGSLNHFDVERSSTANFIGILRLTRFVHPPLVALRSITLALILTSCLSSCADHAPPIGRHLGSADAHTDFDRRVQARFAIGTSEEELLAELQKEGFKISGGNANSMHYPSPTQFRSAAEYSADQFPCSQGWTILWSADHGKVTAIAGDFIAICP